MSVVYFYRCWPYGLSSGKNGCGTALLGGIGLTMNLFVATLVFADPAIRGGAELAIIPGSHMSPIAGLGRLCLVLRAPRAAGWEE